MTIRLYAIGRDAQTARRAGISAVRTGTISLVIAALFVALAGAIIAAMLGVVDPTAIAL